MGACAVCGGNFTAGVLLDLVGLPTGICSFKIGFVDQILYAHDPDCKSTLERAWGIAKDDALNRKQEAEILRDGLPDGPLKKCLIELIATHSPAPSAWHSSLHGSK